MDSLAFLSYQTADKAVAGQLKEILSGIGISAFLAHEDITVSEEWRLKILEQIGRAKIFIALLSKHYFLSPWCVQESGIAVFRGDMTVVPLSLDGTLPQGFMSAFQSVKVDPEDISVSDLAPGFMKHDFALGVQLLIDQIGRSGGYRSAEANFHMILPHLPRMSDEQIKELLERAAANEQVHHASLCASEYLPPLLKSHGRILKRSTLSFLRKICAQYA